jgi:hypothetical protein
MYMIWSEKNLLISPKIKHNFFRCVTRDVVVKLAELFRFTLHPTLKNVLLNEIDTLWRKFIITFLVVGAVVLVYKICVETGVDPTVSPF